MFTQTHPLRRCSAVHKRLRARRVENLIVKHDLSSPADVLGHFKAPSFLHLPLPVLESRIQVSPLPKEEFDPQRTAKEVDMLLRDGCSSSSLAAECMYVCVCACSMFVCGCVHAGLVAGGSLQLTLFRCVRPCALPSRVSGNHDQKCASASGGVLSARACLLLWDGWRLSSRTVVMFLRFVSESFPSRPFPSDPPGVRPPEAPWLIRSGSF